MPDTRDVRVVMVVKFRSRLPDAELERRYRERMPEFRELPGLVQRYYVRDASSGEWGGVYLRDSEESVRSHSESELRRSIAAVYEVEGASRVEMLTVRDRLRS